MSGAAREQLGRMLGPKLQYALDLERLVDALEDLGQGSRPGELLGDTRRHGLAEEDQRAAVGDGQQPAVVDVEHRRSVRVVDRQDLLEPALQDFAERTGKLRGGVAVRGPGE